MAEQSRFPRSLLGRGFPEGFVAGMVGEPSAAPGVLEALARAGFGGDDVRVLPGEWALEIDASDHPSLASEPQVPGEHDASEEFLSGALLGDVLVGVRTRSQERVRVAARILLDEGVGCVHHFGPGSVQHPQELAGSAV